MKFPEELDQGEEHNIAFEYIDSSIPFVEEHLEWIKSWINHTVEGYGYMPGNITYILSDDAYLQDVNLKFLQHEELTDIITFQYSQKPISADIYISHERIKDNSVTFKVPFENELLRVIIHGILHCCGFGDKSEEEKSTMRALEDKHIAIFYDGI